MFAINGPLDVILLGCFLFGLIFTVAVLVVGDLGLGFDAGGDADLGGHDGGMPINLSTLLAFLAWFGGVGYLALHGPGWPVAISLLVGTLAGLTGAAVVTWVMAKLVSPAGSTLDADDYRMPGVLARVSSSIRAGGVGEIVYEQAGVRQVAAAKSESGGSLARGTEVVILGQERGMATVQAAAAFFEEAGVPAGAAGAAAVGEGARRDALM